MEALKFDLIGKYAFFKNPENNTGTEFSFEHIHKPALLGVLGCILGFNGKGQITIENPTLEYYEKLKDIKVSIVPKQPCFQKFKESITNTTGYANDGDTQIITRKVLQDVCWTVYIAKDSMSEQYYNELCSLLKNHESKYPLYLGNNSYKAKIDNFEIVNLKQVEDIENITVNSLFKESLVEEIYDYTEDDDMTPFDLSSMYMPVSLNELTLYNYEWIRFTNLMTTLKDNKDVYQDKENILSFI